MMVAHEGPPYNFKPLPGANFLMIPSYGQIEAKLSVSSAALLEFARISPNTSFDSNILP